MLLQQPKIQMMTSRLDFRAQHQRVAKRLSPSCLQSPHQPPPLPLSSLTLSLPPGLVEVLLLLPSLSQLQR